MPENKNFTERDVPEGEEPKFETLAFNDVKHAEGGNGNWLSHIILDYIPKDLFDQMMATEDFSPEKLQVAITINGVQVIHAKFEAMISEFSGRMLLERMHRGNWHDFEKAVETKARKILKVSLNSFTEMADQLQNNMRQMVDCSDVVLETMYNQPYRYQVTDEMKDAGAAAYVSFGDFKPTETNHRILADRIYNAMVKAKPEGTGANITLKLPEINSSDSCVDERELKGRQDMFDEMEAALLAVGIDIEKLARRQE